MKISYAILTHNEGEYIQNLLSILTQNIRPEDEIVIVDDYSDDALTIDILNIFSSSIKLHYRTFDGDHTQKNYLNSLCSGDYILQLDADEFVTEDFIQELPNILTSNSEIDLFIIPRINTVYGLTTELANKWGWKLNEKGWINFPDWQMRLYRNCDWVKWEGLLHSKIEGYKTYTNLPLDDMFCIIHHKHLDRQVKQNELYSKIDANGRKKYKV
jgi:glycosyltransferase involved in cell wall biosynthesis